LHAFVTTCGGRRKIDTRDIKETIAEYRSDFLETLACPSSSLSFLFVILLIRIIILIEDLSRDLGPYMLIWWLHPRTKGGDANGRPLL
jgi:hypothetical protein